MSDQERITKLVREMVALYTNEKGVNPFNEDYNPIHLLNQLSFISKKVVLKSIEMDLKITISVANTTGECLFCYQMPGSILASLMISKRKAYTAVAMRKSTKLLHELVQPHAELYQLETISDGKIVTFAGGIPIFDLNNHLIGGVGISGAPLPEDDHLLAEVFIKEFKQCYFSI